MQQPPGRRLPRGRIGYATARHQSRPPLGDTEIRQGADVVIARFTEAYVRQNARDYAALRDSVTGGRVAAEPDL
jgi:hypothetical protein